MNLSRSGMISASTRTSRFNIQLQPSTSKHLQKQTKTKLTSSGPSEEMILSHMLRTQVNICQDTTLLDHKLRNTSEIFLNPSILHFVLWLNNSSDRIWPRICSVKYCNIRATLWTLWEIWCIMTPLRERLQWRLWVISAPKLSTPKRESKLWLPSFF